MLNNMKNLQKSRKAVPLQRVFHSIRFKVNKGWSTAVLLFFSPLFITIDRIIKTTYEKSIFRRILPVEIRSLF